MNGSTKFAIFILIIVVILGEMGKEGGDGYPKLRPNDEQALPPLADAAPEGFGEIGPASPRDPIVEIEDELKAGRQQYTGTAFSIDERGLWVTARHVTNGCDQLTLLRPSNRPLRVRNIAEHVAADVSILQTDSGYEALPIDYSNPIFNQEGFHFGFPQGEPGAVYSKLIGRRTIKTTGTRRVREPVFVWAEKIRVPNHNKSLGGISGGPILNKDGSVVGIHVAGSVRRGRSFSSMPLRIDDLLSQNEVEITNVASSPARLTTLNAAEFSKVGEELRGGLTIAQVLCRTN